MKKHGIGAFLLAGVMILGLTGCGSSKAKYYNKYVKLGDYKGIEYSLDIAEVTEDDIQNKLDSFLDGLKTKDEVTDRAVQDGDIVNIDYVGTMDGEEFEGGSAQGYDLTIGSNSFIEGFEAGLVGHNIGEKVTLTLKFPDEYANAPEKAGKPVTFDVTINSISVENTPELTDALVKDNTDYDTIDAYKESIRKDLEDENKTTAQNNARRDVFDKVVANAEISGYDEDEVSKLIDDEFSNFKQQAASYESYGYSYEDFLSMYGYTSEDALKKGITDYVKEYLNQKMVIYCIADAEGIEVTDEEREEQIKQAAQAYSKSADELKKQYGEEYFDVPVLTQKVMDLIMDNAVKVDSTEAATEAEETTEAATEEETTEAATEADESEEETTEATTEAATEEETTEAE